MWLTYRTEMYNDVVWKQNLYVNLSSLVLPPSDWTKLLYFNLIGRNISLKIFYKDDIWTKLVQIKKHFLYDAEESTELNWTKENQNVKKLTKIWYIYR